jgi:hypothetical protein
VAAGRGGEGFCVGALRGEDGQETRVVAEVGAVLADVGVGAGALGGSPQPGPGSGGGQRDGMGIGRIRLAALPGRKHPHPRRQLGRHIDDSLPISDLGLAGKDQVQRRIWREQIAKA